MKCEARHATPSFFSVDHYQVNHQLISLSLLSFSPRLNPTPTFLGVPFDHTFFFSSHVYSLRSMFFSHLKALHCISASSWGPSKESYPLLCKAFLRLVLIYSSTAWFPFFQRYQIGTPSPDCQSCHHQLLLVLPYYSSFLWGFPVSPTSYPDSLPFGF